MSYLKYLIFAAFAALAPIHGVMGATLALIIVDLASGILAARKRKEPITSAALRRTVSKLLIYQSAIISAFLVEHFLMEDSVPALKLCSSVIGMVELKSILENINYLNGSPIFETILKYIGSDNDKNEPPEPPKAA